MPTARGKQITHYTMQGYRHKKQDTALQQLDKWMTNAQTSPINQQEIIHGLRTWQSRGGSGTMANILEAAKEQELLSWDLA